ncbi:MAG: NUDIX hydrolase [Microthrixaceae bacterium]
MHEWTVAGAVIESGCLWAGCPSDEPGLLLVENERRGGHRDWTTPGGVIDAGEDYRSGLAREVQEETGLTVVTWSDLLYTVSVEAPSLEWTLRVEVHRAEAVQGQLTIGEDPDGIVVGADWVGSDRYGDLLGSSPRWVSEPLIEWLDQRFDQPRSFSYLLDGSGPPDFTVERTG